MSSNPNQCHGKYRQHTVKISKHGNVTVDGSESTTTTVLKGSRIINLHCLNTFISEISQHSSNCKNEITLVGESQDGIATSCVLMLPFNSHFIENWWSNR